MATTTINGDLKIGSGSSINLFGGNVVSQDVAEISANSTATFDVTVTGVLLASNNVVIIETPAGYSANLAVSGSVHADDTVRVVVRNNHNQAENPSAATFNIGVIQFS